MFTYLQVLGLLSAVAGIVAFASRTLTKRAIEYAFESRLEELRQEHKRALAAEAHENALQLEQVKAELIAKQTFIATANDADRVALSDLVKLRAEAYPKLVAQLRRIKSCYENLWAATSPSNGCGPVKLSGETEDAKLVLRALQKLAEMESEFDELLSGVRVFTTRSDYALPAHAKAFAHRWLSSRDRGPFEVGNDVLEVVTSHYAEDVGYLVGEFYKDNSVPSLEADNPAFRLRMKHLAPR